jgi:protein-disulfide isomerase
MRSALLLAVFAIACRSSDGHSQSAPSSAAAGREPQSDSVRDEQAMMRADLGRTRGDSGAMWFLVVSDFQCPFCKRWHDEVYPTLLREYVQTGKIRMAYVNLPLQQHVHAQEAAEAGMCAAAQDKFWQMHDALFATQDRWAPLQQATPVFDSLARAVGVDTAQWRACRRSAAVGRYVDGDRTHVIQVGVRSTPTFLIGNTTRVEGAQPIDVFRHAIAQAMKTDSAATTH